MERRAEEPMKGGIMGTSMTKESKNESNERLTKRFTRKIWNRVGELSAGELSVTPGKLVWVGELVWVALFLNRVDIFWNYLK